MGVGPSTRGWARAINTSSRFPVVIPAAHAAAQDPAASGFARCDPPRPEEELLQRKAYVWLLFEQPAR